MIKTNGKVVYLDLSGGFWGIETEDGEKLNPSSGLPASFQKEGLKVSVAYKPSNAFSIHMWGKNVDLVDISKT